MYKIRLIYVSRMTEACDMAALQDILAVSRKKNAAEGITGILCYDPSFFLQCLEGPRGAVNELYNAILRDPRHKDVLLLDYCETDVNHFPEWSMAFISTDTIKPDLLAQYAGKKKFDPYRMKAEEVSSFLVQLAKQDQGDIDH